MKEKRDTDLEYRAKERSIGYYHISYPQEDKSKDCTAKKQSLESSSSSSDSDDDNFLPNKKNLGSGNDLRDSDPEECTFTDHPKNDSSDNSHLSDPRRRLDANSDSDDFIDNRSSSSMTHYGQASDSSITV